MPCSCTKLGHLFKGDNNAAVEFEKDDPLHMNLITAATNLRAHIFSIPQQTRFEIKQMAGNIIPAIPTTNAIVSGLAVLMAQRVLKNQISQIKTTSIVCNNRAKILQWENLQKPNPDCAICSLHYGVLECPVDHTTLGSVLDTIRQYFELEGDLSVVRGDNALIYDFDLEENEEKTLIALNVKHNSNLIVSVEDDPKGHRPPIYFYIKNRYVNVP